MSIKRDLEFLYEIGTLRHIQRKWRQFLNPDFQNLAEHTFRISWIALVLARHEKADLSKILKMALIHDLAESRTGDADYVSRQYNERHEEEAIKDIMGETVLEDEFIKLIQEYEEKRTIEAKIVKDADNLDVDLELQEQETRGHKLRDVWKTMRREAVYKNLFTKTAKKLWKEIQTSNPHDWHVNAKNRFTAGDWKK